MKIQTKIDNPREVEVTVSVTATVEQWKSIAEVLSKSPWGASLTMYVAIVRQIGNISEYVEKENVG